jgi:hypothetical protein|tara:strand:- start:150 stop:563 length:414 start_codon:yes stop_codon:yes gene_type:complete
MAITYQVVYKNHCTPQEQILDGGRFYLDSDCRRKLTGIASVTVAGGPGESGADSGTYNSSTSVSTTAVEVVSAGSDADFVFIRNAGSTDVLITLDNSLYYMVLSQGEAFASKIHNDANVKVKTASGTTTVETLVLIQ